MKNALLMTFLLPTILFAQPPSTLVKDKSVHRALPIQMDRDNKESQLNQGDACPTISLFEAAPLGPQGCPTPVTDLYFKMSGLAHHRQKSDDPKLLQVAKFEVTKQFNTYLNLLRSFYCRDSQKPEFQDVDVVGWASPAHKGKKWKDVFSQKCGELKSLRASSRPSVKALNALTEASVLTYAFIHDLQVDHEKRAIHFPSESQGENQEVQQK